MKVSINRAKKIQFKMRIWVSITKKCLVYIAYGIKTCEADVSEISVSQMVS